MQRKPSNRKAEDVLAFNKIAEGGFNGCFEVSFHGRNRALARIPYPITLPKHLTVASEVATMDFLRSKGVPVPRVYGYSATADNAVGSEYIIMEMVNGKEVGDIWFHMSEKERLKLIYKVAEVEGPLFSIRLPASGSIYYDHDLAAGVKRVEIPGPHRDNKRFCIGPETTLSLWYGHQALLSVDQGPCECFQDYQTLQHLTNRRFRPQRRAQRWSKEGG